MRITLAGQGRIAEAHHAAMPELYFRVALWLAANPRATSRQVANKFDVSRSTAYRWRLHFAAATGAA
ncbi:helix-turn-helix domain-containing protein [Lysobacter olei]